MGLGKTFMRADTAAQHLRMIVSDGWRIAPAADLVGDQGWGHYGLVRALGVPGVGRAVTLISDLIGGLPWDAYTTHGREIPEKISPRPMLLEQPNPEEIRMVTFAAWAVDYLLHGNAIGVIAERNALGVPTAVVPVPACRVGVRRAGGQTYAVLPEGAIEYSIGSRTFSSHEVIHVKALAEPGALRGVGVLEAHLNGAGALDLAGELARQARNIDGNGVPTGVLKAMSPDVTEDQLRAAKLAWMTSQRDRTVAALGPGTEFEALAWNPEELQLIEARKFSLLEVANIFGLPPRYLGASSGDSMTYSTSETEAIELLKLSIGGHLTRFEQTLSLAFPRGTQVRADLSVLLRSDTTARYNAYKTGIDAGFLLPSEARAKEDDLPPVEGIDHRPRPQQSPPEQPPGAVVPLSKSKTTPASKEIAS
ncbi:phage portal protein [Amycolatopsis sp. 195334CR]|uniref:phage portal protein n=1 Tax=Amycolatopsis sp. 195334CR TaxID=2814588 RepID=UPI001A8E7C73|nr:phage portal protein [Amycolatopsis sp. 195334CR]MBN6037469.1 phage portal protein [Amycolatopsis sp. 195334CR]